MNEDQQAAAVSTPPPIDDRIIEQTINRFHRLRWATVGALAALIIIALTALATTVYYQQAEIAALHRQQEASCQFFTDLASLPVQPIPPVPRPSRLGVSIVVHSRLAAIGRNCPNVPPLDPSVKRWAAYYHIPVP